ncbi:hypothetical protein DY000_02041229 [Brassica cretica]|uniref:Secreted protein n=1 Tax=Brassica cretica TaxID=69181 RepID=A0ABQ7BB21_BRACR|nr:hypothetical protein DY000_02041229 [Brassica cretica]
MLKAVMWSVGSAFPAYVGRRIFSAGRYRTSVTRREKGVLRVSARTRSISGTAVSPSSIRSFMSRNDCLSSASSRMVTRSTPPGV